MNINPPTATQMTKDMVVITKEPGDNENMRKVINKDGEAVWTQI